MQTGFSSTTQMVSHYFLVRTIFKRTIKEKELGSMKEHERIPTDAITCKCMPIVNYKQELE